MYLDKLPAIRIKYTGSAASAFAFVESNRLYTKLAGAVDKNLSFDDYPTVKSLVDQINLYTPDYSAELASGSFETPVTNEQHIIPTSPPYQVQLLYIPKNGTLYVLGFTEVSYTPGPGQYRTDYNTGILEFNINNNGNAWSANYIGLQPADLNTLASEYLEIYNNKAKNIKSASFVNLTYHRRPSTVKRTKEHLVGVPLDRLNKTISDEYIENRLNKGMEALEDKLKIYLREYTIKCDHNPYGLATQVGLNCDRIEPPYDGTDTNYIKLRYEPLISIDRLELVYLGNLVRSYPFEWIQTNKFRSEVRIVPQTGSFNLMGMYSGSYLFHSFFPRSTSMFGHFLPWIQCDYTAGFKFGEVPAGIVEALELLTANAVLLTADGLISPGLSSKSIDGVSESYARTGQNTIYGGRRKENQDRITELLKPWTRMRFTVA